MKIGFGFSVCTAFKISEQQSGCPFTQCDSGAQGNYSMLLWSFTWMNISTMPDFFVCVHSWKVPDWLQKLGFWTADCLWLPFQPVSHCCPGPSLQGQEWRLLLSDSAIFKDFLLYLGKILIQSLKWACAWLYTLQLGPVQTQNSSERTLAGLGQGWQGELTVRQLLSFEVVHLHGWILPSRQPFLTFD